jgi:hypothetical protein
MNCAASRLRARSSLCRRIETGDRHPNFRFQFSDSREDMRPHSRGAMRPRFGRICCPSQNRGRRESRVPIAPMGPVQQKARGTTGSTGITPAFPAQWFTAYFVLPGDRAFLPPSLRRSSPQSLAQHRGARTTRLRRPLEPRSSVVTPASTASHRNVRDDRDPPLSWVRRAEFKQ